MSECELKPTVCLVHEYTNQVDPYESKMESVSKAHARMLKFPKLLAECRLEGSMYAACISTNQDNIKKDGCKEEFDKLRKCVVKAAAKLGTRI
ncbi:hypothetical protein J6590_004586 [Homalodisca vitripennis]|nr:hypothetical protein J6590_004586 [Homalodisca vitripennis]